MITPRFKNLKIVHKGETICVLTKPLPLPSFKQYLQTIIDKQYYTPRALPCINCRGCGKVWHPDSEPDPVEGNKMRDSVECQICSGTGEGSQDQYKPVYNALKEQYKIDKIKFETELNMVKSVLDKITTEEWKFVNNCVVSCANRDSGILKI